MLEIKGRKSTAICYSKTIRDRAVMDIRAICDHDFTENRRIRIMPDVHPNGDGTVTGFTMTLGEPLVLGDTELDNSITLQSGGSWINKQSMELKAFHNEEDGQMYQNSDSPVDKFHVTWNYIYTGTPIALKKKVNERNFGSGLSTRTEEQT